MKAGAALLKAEYVLYLIINCVFILTGLCGRHNVDTEIGQTQHYRKKCYQDPCPQAKSVVRDDWVWNHLDTIIENSNRAINAIKFDYEKDMLSSRK